MERSCHFWYKCVIGKGLINLPVILRCGQAFRWKEHGLHEWIGVIGDRVWVLRQDDDAVYYRVIPDYNQSNKPIVDVNLTENSDVDNKNVKENVEELPTIIDCSAKKRTSTNQRKKLKSKSVKIEPNIDVSKIQTEDAKFDVKKVKNSNDLISEVKQENCQNPKTESRDLKLLPVNNKLQEIFTDYFQLDVDLLGLYEKWTQVDSNFKDMLTLYPGIRLMRQDPVENLFTFICSSNNHISRITSMVEKMCIEYGDRIAEVDGECYYSFAKVERMAEDGVEENLRRLGFGYRAAYVCKTARYIMEQEKQVQWLYGLRQETYDVAKRSLMALHGVGAKVADCVCLMSLDKMAAVPVDTHVWQIAQSYLPSLSKHKSVTDRVYNEIADYFQNLWGPYAGWAQAVLFAADLPQFKKSEKPKKVKKKTK